MKNLLKAIFYWINRIKFNLKNRGVKICKGACVSSESLFEGKNVINSNTSFHGVMGYGSYIGRNCAFNGKIGKYCSIASYVKTIVSMHPSNTFVSTHPMFFSE